MLEIPVARSITPLTTFFSLIQLAAKRAEALVPTASQAFMSTLSGGIFPTRKVSLRPEKAASAGDVVQEMQAIERETYKRNAIVSRLGNIADVVSMVSL